MSPIYGVGDVQSGALEFTLCIGFDIAQLRHIGKVQDGLANFQAHRWIDLVDVKQIGLRSDKRDQRHHNRFANRVDRWVGHLREQLLEVVVERFVFARQHGQGAVIAHRANAFFTVDGHGGH